MPISTINQNGLNAPLTLTAPVFSGNVTATTITSPAATALTLQSAGTTAITVNTSQNVGIGTTNPSFKLHVESGYGFFAGANRGVILGESNCVILGDSGTTNAANMVFYTANAERMRILSNGSILLGTTTAEGATGISFSNASDSAAYGKSMYMNSPYNGTRNAISFAYNSSGVGAIVTGTSSTSYNSGSDYRLKNGIQPITNALQKVALLKPSKWTWKVDNTYGDGFVAHELAEVCPHAVTGEKDAVDADGKPVYQGVDTSFLVATLTAAIQELKAEFDEYKRTHP